MNLRILLLTIVFCAFFLSVPQTHEQKVALGHNVPPSTLLYAPTNPAADQNAVKIHVTEPGIQLVTGADLMANGVPVDTPLISIQIADRGTEIAVEVLDDGNNGTLDPSDSLRFYAHHSEHSPTVGDYWNHERIYWLTFHGTNGLRMVTRNVLPSSDATVRPIAIEKGIWEENNLYESTMPGVDGDNWFHDELRIELGQLNEPTYDPSLWINLNHNLPLATSSLPSRFMISGSSSSVANHALQVNLGATDETIYWTSRQYYESFSQVISSTVSHPDRLQLTLLPGSWESDIRIDKVYWEQPVNLDFSNGGAAFSGVSGIWRYELTNVAADAALYDVTDPNQPQRLQLPTGSRPQFEDGPEPRDYILATTADVHQPELSKHEPVTWPTNGGAHSVYIGYDYFHDELEPLLELRRDQGYEVQAVDLQSIYDSWSFGQVSPDAVRNMLQYADANWGLPPMAAIAVGDSTYDPKNYLGRMDGNYNRNIFPAFLESVDPWLGETACENCFAQLDGLHPLDEILDKDFHTDIWFGRFSVQDEAQLTAVVNKIIHYETAPADSVPNQDLSLYFADNFYRADGTFDPAGDFAATLDDTIKHYQSPQLRTERLYYDPSYVNPLPAASADGTFSPQGEIDGEPAGQSASDSPLDGAVATNDETSILVAFRTHVVQSAAFGAQLATLLGPNKVLQSEAYSPRGIGSIRCDDTSATGLRLAVNPAELESLLAQLNAHPDVLFAVHDAPVYAANRFDAYSPAYRAADQGIDEAAVVIPRDDVSELEFEINDPLYEQQRWYMEQIQADDALAYSFGLQNGQPSTSTVVAIIDSGIDSEHPEFHGRILPGYNFLEPESPPFDDNGHGTHVAGLIGATVNNELGIAGLAPNVIVRSYKVLDRNGGGRIDNVVKAICRAADDGADIINLSLTSPSQNTDQYSAAFDYARDHGVLMVAAVGNSRQYRNMWPARLPEVMGIAATNADGTVTEYSSPGDAIDLAAPGGTFDVALTSTWPSDVHCNGTTPAIDEAGGAYCTSLGTSASAALVSGVAALLMELHPEATAEEIRHLLTSTAQPMVDGAEYVGHGLLNAKRAAMGNQPWREPVPQWTQARALQLLRTGAALATFNGHSNQVQIGRIEQLPLGTGHIVGFNDLLQLDAHPFVMLQMTNHTSQFQHISATGTTFDERLLRLPNSGAVAVWGAAGLSVNTGQPYLLRGFHLKLAEALEEGRQPLMGELVEAGYNYLFQHSTSYQDVRKTYLLLGDPLTPLRIDTTEPEPGETPTPVTPTPVTPTPALPTATSSPGLGTHSLYHPVIRKAGNTQTTLFLHTESGVSNTYQVEFLNRNGEGGFITDPVHFYESMTLGVDEIDELNDGLYTAIVRSDAEVSSVVRIYDEEAQSLSLYRGTPDSYTADTLFFGPFFKTPERSSAVHLSSAHSEAATAAIEVLNADGQPVASISDILVHRGGTTITADELELPADFTGWIRASADNRLAGLLAPTSEKNQIGLHAPTAFGGTLALSARSSAPLPPAATYFYSRVYSQKTLKGGARNTSYFLGNIDTSSSSLSQTIYEVGSTYEIGSPVGAIPAQSFLYGSLSDHLGLGGEFTGSMVVSSDRPLAVGGITESTGGDLLASYGSSLFSSSVDVDTTLVMPYIAHDSLRSSILTVQNVGWNDADVAVSIVTQGGSLEVKHVNIAPNRSQSFHTEDWLTLGDEFVGSVTITSDHFLYATLDEFLKVETSSPTLTPEAPTPETPTPEAPTPETPTVETPTPEPPTPETPTPETPIPEAPTSEPPTPEPPTPEPSEMPTDAIDPKPPATATDSCQPSAGGNGCVTPQPPVETTPLPKPTPPTGTEKTNWLYLPLVLD